jgi:hypothetical protein
VECARNRAAALRSAHLTSCCMQAACGPTLRER